MHDHLQKSYGGYSDIFKVMRIGFPGFRRVDGLLLIGIVGIKGISMWINKLDIVIKFWDYKS
jgi:hypothetical protein